MIAHSFEFYSIAFFGIILIRYLLVAEGTYWFFYLPLDKPSVDCNLRHWSSSWQSIQQDTKLSILSAGVFALAAAIIMSGYDSGSTCLYSQYQQYGLWYSGVSYGVIFAFDPLETIIQAFFLVGIVFVIPLHFMTLIAVLITMTVWAMRRRSAISRSGISSPVPQLHPSNSTTADFQTGLKDHGANARMEGINSPGSKLIRRNRTTLS